MKATQINFRPLEINDLSLLHSWFHEPFILKHRSGSKNSDQNFKKLRYNSRQENWRRDERSTQKIHAS